MSHAFQLYGSIPRRKGHLYEQLTQVESRRAGNLESSYLTIDLHFEDATELFLTF